MTKFQVPDNVQQGIDPETTYEKLELIGEGSFGNVYKARLKENGELAAVKIVRFSNNDELQECQVYHWSSFFGSSNNR